MSNVALAGCHNCSFRSACGGLEGQQGLYGCFHQTHDERECAAHGWTCVCRPTQLAHRFQQVGGIAARTSPITGLTNAELPLYVPMIRHGSKHRTSVNLDVAAVSTFDMILGGKRTKYGPRSTTPASLRASFGLSETTRVLLISVAFDERLERYWALRGTNSVPTDLAKLGADAISVPNFSFFTDAPRTHTLYNRRRMAVTALELSNAGLSVMPHLNASTRADWDYWAQYLSDNPTVSVVCKEFHTGLQTPALAQQALNSLDRLQRDVGRPLHPVVVGGARLAGELAKRFRRFTIIDSIPFIKAASRRKLYVVDDRPHWRKHRVEMIDGLLEHNVATYRQWIARTVRRERQLALPLARRA